MADEKNKETFTVRGSVMTDEGSILPVVVAAPSQAELESALAEYESHSDRVLVLKKFPFLVPILNKTKK